MKEEIHALLGRTYTQARGGWSPIITFEPSVGFWTSSAQIDGRSSWTDLASRHQPEGTTMHGHHYAVVGDPHILVLRSQADVAAAMERLSLPTTAMTPSIADAFWVAAAEAYDAVHVPAKYERWSILHFWDVESTVWFRGDLYLSTNCQKDTTLTT